MVAAAVQFTQGATVGPAGMALFGVQGTAVTVANGNNSGVTKWTFFVVDVPPGSSIPIGVVQTGASSTWSFTPDHTDSFLIGVTVQDAQGNTATDIRSFTVKRTSGPTAGFWIPPFSGGQQELNFGGSSRGWAPAMEDWIHYLDGLSAGGGGIQVAAFSISNAGGSSVTAPPASSRFLRAYLRILTGFSNGATLKMGIGATPALLFDVGTVDDALGQVSGPSTDLIDVALTAVQPSTTPIVATVGGSPSTGQALGIVIYGPSVLP